MTKTEELRGKSHKLLAGYGLSDEQITELTQRWLLLSKEGGLKFEGAASIRINEPTEQKNIVCSRYYTTAEEIDV
jgi:hypothetical protein